MQNIVLRSIWRKLDEKKQKIKILTVQTTFESVFLTLQTSKHIFERISNRDLAKIMIAFLYGEKPKIKYIKEKVP